MKALPWILIVLLALAVLFLWNRQQELSTLPRLDTTEYVETIPIYYPVPRDSVVIRYKYAKLPVKKDTCKVKQDTCTPDSAEVVIPITQKIYEDSLYRAWVSGYNAKLDSIVVYSRTREIRIPVFIPAKRKRWGLGLQAGYGYPNGLYVGVGVSYNLWQW
ncbi:hypothetical protein F3B42_14125 [Bacteroides ovatus]|nr:hypothetical protein F3B42_14125 [Bacteroides ovatus]KAA4680720.1 hypothetical protein F3B41_15415 [Bacteroides ovatus]